MHPFSCGCLVQAEQIGEDCGGELGGEVEERSPAAGLGVDAEGSQALAEPGDLYIREDRILPHLPALHILMTSTEPDRRRRRTRRGTGVAPPPASAQDVISYLRDHEIILTCDPPAGTLHADTHENLTATIGRAS